jgi:hypothetical protein
MVALGCGKTPEPAAGPAASRDAAATPAEPRASAAAPTRLGSSSERRLSRAPLHNDLCSEGVKRVNVLHGRTETDRKGVHLLSRCLRDGTAAWYSCVLEATSGDAADECAKKHMGRGG